MPEIPLRNRPLRQLATTVTVSANIIGSLLIITALVQWMRADFSNIPCLLLAAGCFLCVLSLLLYAGVRILLKAEGNIHRLYDTSLELTKTLQRMEPLVKTASNSIQISDAVRAITHREMEQEALRNAIRDEMYRGDWEATHYLINEMERRFGYKQEAQKLREEMAVVREMTIEEKIGEAISHIEKLMDENHWERSLGEIERLIKLFPQHERVKALAAELNRRRSVRKQELLTGWKQAVERNEIDQGIAILTELDPYLTGAEAQQLQESARGVFKARLLNLGVQFGLAVSEARWRNALEVGLQIRQEFPNSRMAQEVAQRMETLRVRAGYVPDAEIIQQQPAPPHGPTPEQ